MGAKNKKREKRNTSIGTILIAVSLSALFLGVYCIMLWGTVRFWNHSIGQSKAIKNGEMVRAVLNDIGISSRTDGNHQDYDYYVTYEYVDGDITYSGVYSTFNEYYKAEKYLGKTIYIYIDGNGNSIPVSHRVDFFSPIFLTVLDIVLFYPMVLLVPFIHSVVKWEEKIKKRKEENKGLFFTRR